MNFNDLIGYKIEDAIEIVKKFSNKQIIVKDNNSNVKNHNITSVVRITEDEYKVEIITSNFVFLD